MKTFVKLNRPLLINTDSDPEKIYKTIYGYFYDDGNGNANYRFVCYLAAMHEWTSGSEDFTMAEEGSFPVWIDKDGITRFPQESWSLHLGEKCKEKLGLDYKEYAISPQCEKYERDSGTWDNPESTFTYGNYITNEDYMDYLVCISDPIEKEEADQQSGELIRYTVSLLNKPLWLPRESIWEGEEGYFHVYGVAIDREFDRELVRELQEYIAYLSLSEEYLLNDETPSGFTATCNNRINEWYDEDGNELGQWSQQIKDEAVLCKEKNNYRTYDITLLIPKGDMEKAVKSNFIISKDLYDSLIDIAKEGYEEDV